MGRLMIINVGNYKNQKTLGWCKMIGGQLSPYDCDYDCDFRN